jgi:hypothetical protein
MHAELAGLNARGVGWTVLQGKADQVLYRHPRDLHLLSPQGPSQVQTQHLPHRKLAALLQSHAQAHPPEVLVQLFVGELLLTTKNLSRMPDQHQPAQQVQVVPQELC